MSRTFNGRDIRSNTGSPSSSSSPSLLSSTTTHHPSWFSGLRARISQLSMPEWLSQLGIGNSNYARSAGNVADDVVSETNINRPDSVASERTVQDSKSEPEKQPDNLSKCPVATNGTDESPNAETNSWQWDNKDCCDTLAVQHFGPLRNLVTGCNHPGKGHDFLGVSVAHPTWCDKCGDFMWGFLTRAVKCDNCNYTCHEKCKSLVTLDCRTADSTLNSCQELSFTSVYPSLQTFVESEDIAVEDNGDKVTGFVQIHMNFLRPINVVAGDSLSFLDVTNQSGSVSTCSLRTITTFFLPRNTVKNVNISSSMTTRQMIVTLLRKFKVADNPRKFALYERQFEISRDQTLRNCRLTRIPDDSYPLKIVRTWEKNGEKRHLVLQENDTGDILWDMFEIPELENFLKILEDEERQYTSRIRQKYDAYRYYLDENLRNRGLAVDSDQFRLTKNNSCIATDV